LVTRRAEADNYASDVRNRAETEAAGMIESAREEAERLLAEAHAAVEKLTVARDRSSAEIARLVADAHTEAEIIRSEALRIRDEAIHRRDLVRAQLAEVRERVSQAVAGDLDYTMQREEPTLTAAEQATNDVAVRSS